MDSEFILIKTWMWNNIHMHENRLPLSAAGLFFVGKVKIQTHIESDHSEVQDIHGQHIPYDVAAEDLAENTAEVTGIDKHQKSKAFALWGFVF